MNIRVLTGSAVLALLAFACQPTELMPETEEIRNEIAVNEPLIIVGKVDAEMTFDDVKSEGVKDPASLQERTSGFTETFENASKTSYAGANANLSSGSYYMSDALIGTSGSDRKTGSRAARVRNTGYVMMNFNMDAGFSSVSVRHAKYGGDGNSTWSFIISYDNGGSWYYYGNSVTTSSTSLQTVTVNTPVSGSAKLAIYKTGGGSNRINFDEFKVNTGSSGGGGGTSSPTRDGNLVFGDPSKAGTSSNNYQVDRYEYSYAYDNSKGRARWVSWHLSNAWRGGASRQDDFRADPSLPSSFFRADQNSYRNSGFDRGHICPSADRTYSTSANSATFYMSNMMPQSPRNNQQTWRYFEDYLRKLADQGNEIHIIAGPAGQGGTGRNGYASTIASGNIDVPSSTWKVAIVLPNGS
ncbi:MAG TPA: DNA/RNA non-specific endonuclease, partial [Cytophagales bacterium]|nr:DNA/RNA non-specific endonuclease [Cytophagales bacterium]